MALQIAHWEHHLLDMAYQALEGHAPVEGRIQWDSQKLQDAYRICDEITHYHSRTFFLASGLLSEEKRRAIRALYAFCRHTDDLVDRAQPMGEIAHGLQASVRLAEWRKRIVSPAEWEKDPVVLAWTDTRLRYGIPIQYVEQLIQGVGADLDRNTYSNFHELATYCYGVACTVGLMSMHIIGYRGAEAIPYAIRLGVALQLTNILRDVGEDWRAGRIYLPLDELA